MNRDSFITSFRSLKAYCEKEDFAGWDPYDGLNSKLFKALPLVGRSAVARLVWIQLFKRCPVNLRPLLGVAKGHNAKGIGLFLAGYCRLYRSVGRDESLAATLDTPDRLMVQIRRLADLLLEMRSPSASGSAWGYNFPWQCRREFLFPDGEPTVVATYFCAMALFDAFELTGDVRYRDTALSAADFVKKDLRRTPCGPGVILSYSRMPGNDTIYNASLLGSALLARCYSYDGNADSLNLARESMDACCAMQASDGSWTYGVKPVTSWIDSFHTGYNLMAVSQYMRYSGEKGYEDALSRGLRFYLDNFFMADGSPKYYHNRQYPIDIHCPGQLAVTLSELDEIESNRPLLERVMTWTVDNMQSPDGYFYYQKKQGISSKISYMRWSNAFMFAAMSYIVDNQ